MGTITISQSEPGNNGNEEVLHMVKTFQVLLINISNFLYQVFLFDIDNLHTAV